MGGWLAHRLVVDPARHRHQPRLPVGHVALRALQIVDRYWLKALVDIDAVGAYVLFTGIAKHA
jgi:hypothetical protein